MVGIRTNLGAHCYPFKSVNVQLSLEALVPRLVEIFLHDCVLKALWIVNLEGSVALPGDNVFESKAVALLENSVEFPWEGGLPITGDL